MRTTEELISQAMPYATLEESEEWEKSYDLTDISDDFPFAAITWNPSSPQRPFDVCEVRTCIEYGNEIRDDKILASQCTLEAAVAVAQAIHVRHYPAKRRAYAQAPSIFGPYQRR